MSQVSGRRPKLDAFVGVLLLIALAGCGGGTALNRVDSGNSGSSGSASRGSGGGNSPPHSLTVQISPVGSGVVISTPAGINCGASCNASFVSGSVIALIVSPAQGFAFTGWGGACSGPTGCNVKMDADRTVVANFGTPPPTQFTLSISTAGSGTITSNPAGISCGQACSGSFDAGTTVILTANPSSGFVFAGWSGPACTGISPCAVRMNSNVSVNATFVPLFSLGVNLAGTGSGTVSSSPAGINCAPTCSTAQPSGTIVGLAATPSSGSVFSGWAGGCVGTGQCAVTLNTNQTVTATFDTASLNSQYTLTLAKAGAGSGSVTSSPSGIDCGTACTSPFNSGTSVVLTATPDAGSAFAGWSSAACTGTAPCTVVMNSDTTVTATFIPQFTLSVSTSGKGSGTVTSSPSGISCNPTCSVAYDSGTIIGLAATPATGSIFSGWGGACSGNGNCNVTMASNQTVTATFNPEPPPQYTLSITNAGTGSGTVTSSPVGIDCGLTCSSNYDSGTLVTLAATPDDGSSFGGWYSAFCTGIGGCVIPMNSAQSVTSTFVLVEPLFVSIIGVDGGGFVTSSPAGIACPNISCAANFNQNTSVTLTAIPTTGNQFNGWTGDCSGINTCTVSIGTSPQFLSADFEVSNGKTGAAPFLSLSPSPFDFGAVQIQTTSSKTIQLSNTGTDAGGNLIVSQVTVDNPLFVVDSSKLPMTIAPGSSSSISITFSPQALGSESGTMSFVSNASNSVTSLSINGIGSTTTSSGALNIFPTSVFFGNVDVGTTQTQTVTISNPGTSSTTVFAGTASGGGFGIASPTFPLTLLPGTSQDVVISFTPPSSGPVTGVITFTSDASSTPVASLIASGNTAAQITSLTVSPSDLSFGAVPVGGSYSATLVLYNTGNLTVDVSGANVAGIGFDVVGTQFPITIPLNSSQAITVSFTANVLGTSSGTVTFKSNATSGNSTATLLGTGVIASGHTAMLTWFPSPSAPIGYNVYRLSPGSGYERLAFTAQTAFTDATVQSGQIYTYAVTAVGSSGIESSFSNEAVAAIP